MTADRQPPHELMAAALGRPLIRVNQVGYRATGPKRATVISDRADALAFRVVDGRGHEIHGGSSLRGPAPDPTSGMPVHTIDFSELSGAWPRCRIEIDRATVSHWFRVGDDILDGLVHDALRFFYAQRSGMEISDEIMPGYGRPAGHVGVPPNRGDTAVRAWTGPDADALYPGWSFTGEIDASGGWYDAGDHGKYVVNGGLAASLLLSAHEVGAARRRPRPRPAPPGPSLLDEARWQVEWMVKMQVPAGHQHAGLAFHRLHDDHWTPLPLLPHDDPAERVLHRPSTAAGLNLAAAAAHAARLVGSRATASRYLQAARTAYDAAVDEPSLLAPDDQGAFGGGPYNDDKIDDEPYWAAVELYLTTGETRYLDDLTASPCHRQLEVDLDGFDWDEVALYAHLQLVRHGSELPDRAAQIDSILETADALLDLQARQPWGQPYAPDDGWDWGSNGRICNNLIVLCTAHDLTDRPRYRDGVLAGVDYLLGRNPVGLSYVTGYGSDHAHRQRARHFGHALDATFPPPPDGSLAGGPASKTYPGFPGDPRFEGCPPQLCYVDEPTSETTNDVAIRWNGALVWVASWLQHL
jgi:endoglucanase